MKKQQLACASDANNSNASFRDSITQLLVDKLSDESRINRIIDKLKVRYTHLSRLDYERALQPILCLDPALLYRLLRDCTDASDGLSDESGLCFFKDTMHSILTQLIASGISSDILDPSQVGKYDSLAFGKLAGAKLKLALDENLIESLNEAFSRLELSSAGDNQKKGLLPSHLRMSIDSCIAYLMATLARSRSNPEFRSRVGLDVIKSSYTSLKLSKNFPILQVFDSGQAPKPLPVQSRLVSRITDESLARFLRGMRVSEGSLRELSEYLNQFISLLDAESKSVTLRKSIASLESELSIIESEKKELAQEISRIKKLHSDELDGLKSNFLSKERGNSVENAELGQRIRSILIESRRRIDSEITKLELLLQSSAEDNASSKNRLASRIRNTITELEAKLLEVIS
jgi:hypothetical protein